MRTTKTLKVCFPSLRIYCRSLCMERHIYFHVRVISLGRVHIYLKFVKSMSFFFSLDLLQKKKKKKKKKKLTLSVPNFRRDLSPAFLFFLTNYRLKRNLYVKLKDWMSNITSVSSGYMPFAKSLLLSPLAVKELNMYKHRQNPSFCTKYFIQFMLQQIILILKAKYDKHCISPTELAPAVMRHKTKQPQISDRRCLCKRWENMQSLSSHLTCSKKGGPRHQVGDVHPSEHP